MLGIIVTKRQLETNPYVSPEMLKYRDVDVRFIRPDGRIGSIGGVSIVEDGRINDFSLEYLCLEFTRDCNVRCRDCYVLANRIGKQEPRYIDLDFVFELANQLDYSPSAGWREIAISGGEPTLDMTKLQSRYAILNELIPDKDIVIATNLLAVPHSETAIAEFFARFPGALIQASYNPWLEKQYETIASNLSQPRYSHFEGKVSQRVRPESALLEKIRLFDDYAHKIGRKFYIRVNGVTREEAEKYKEKAISYMGTKGRAEGEFIFSHRVVRIGGARDIDGVASADDPSIRECGDREELYMCFNGALFPGVNFIEKPKKRIGTLVRLLEVKTRRGKVIYYASE